MVEESKMYEFNKLADDIGIEIMDLKGLYTSFIEEMDSEIMSLQSDIKSGNLKGLQSTVHNIKGISSNLLINDIYEHCQIFDKELKAENFQNVRIHMSTLESMYKSTRDYIKVFFKI
jgi:HPt (histidine-containing phosphotransfer) domain-containing protein